MNLSGTVSMEEISLDDVDRNSMEYKLFLLYAKRRLSPSKYEQLLEREKKNQEGSLERMKTQGPETANQGLPSEDQKHPPRRRNKKKIKWKSLIPSCIRGQAEKESTQTSYHSRNRDDSNITLLADRLAGIVDHARPFPRERVLRGLVCPDSLEEDGGRPSKSVSEDDGGKDEEQKIIDTIVALLRKSGDDLEEKMQTDKTFSQRFLDLMMSYIFFRKLTNQFLKDATADLEDQAPSTKVAFAMEVITRLTAVDNHPMNAVLGFGMKYLKENFSPWIHSQGRGEEVLDVSDHDVD